MGVSTAQLYRAWANAPEPKMPRRPYDPTRGIYLSEMGGCERKVSLRLLKYPQQAPSTETRVNFTKGLLWEEYLALVWEHADLGKVWRQEPIQTPYGNGKVDVWVPAINYVVEVKTTESKNAGMLPFSSHVDQALMYLHFYQCMLHAPATRPDGEVAYAFADTREVVSYPVKYDLARVNEILGWGDKVQSAIRAGAPLPIPANAAPDAAPCMYGAGNPCAFYAHCWEDIDRD